MSDDTSRLGIVVSRADRASEHIGDELLEQEPWKVIDDDHYLHAGDDESGGMELRIYDELHLELSEIARDYEDVDFLVFVSRHSGDTGALLSAHFTGNLGTAAFGGDDHELAQACPNAQRLALDALDSYAPEGYAVSLECTHHGPSTPGAPAMFVELGSGDDQWDDPDGASAVANAVIDLQGTNPTTSRTFVSFGGGHYAPRPTRIVRDTDWASGHIAADWALDDLGTPSNHRDAIAQVFDRSNAHHAIIDGDHPDLESTIEALGYRVVSETWIRETDGVSLSLVERLEETITTVAAGLRFGDAATEISTTTAIDVIDLPRELIQDAAGIDMHAITDAADATSIAYDTRENGNRVGDRAAFTTESRYESFIDGVCDVLERKYHHVERRPDEIVVHERAFDPKQAASLGVPEGPKFGALVAGESVVVDGQTVTPADVTIERIRRYHW